MNETFTCHHCHETKPVQTSGGTGYGYDAQANFICYACCAIRDRADMAKTGKATLYLCSYESEALGKAHKLTNWPGTLTFYLHRSPKVSKQYTPRGHWIKRSDVWFTGPDGKRWHGYQCGDNTQICHCRRTKA